MTNARQFRLEAHACSQLEGVLKGMGDPMVPPEKSVDSRTFHEADCPHTTAINENTTNINRRCDDMFLRSLCGSPCLKSVWSAISLICDPRRPMVESDGRVPFQNPMTSLVHLFISQRQSKLLYLINSRISQHETRTAWPSRSVPCIHSRPAAVIL